MATTINLDVILFIFGFENDPRIRTISWWDLKWSSSWFGFIVSDIEINWEDLWFWTIWHFMQWPTWPHSIDSKRNAFIPDLFNQPCKPSSACWYSKWSAERARSPQPIDWIHCVIWFRRVDYVMLWPIMASFIHIKYDSDSFRIYWTNHAATLWHVGI